MKLIEKLKANKYVPYIIILLLSITISIALFTMNLSEYNEARIHIGRIISVKESLANNVFHGLISPKHMLGFGYALNIFYGPITTYLPILISFITNSEVLALKIFTFLTVLLSGITMYNFLYAVSKSKKISLIGALIYIAAPYKLTDIYSRNAVGEYTAFIFIPLLFQGLYNLLNSQNKLDKIRLSDKSNILIILGAVGLVLSHTITTIYVAIFALAYLLLNYKKVKNIKTIKSLSLDLLMIILLTAFYLLPLVEHKAYGNYTIYDPESMWATGREVYSTGIGLKEWISNEFGKQEIVFSFGIVIIFGLILTPFAFKKAKEHKEYKTFGLLALLALYLDTKLFPWMVMPNFLTIIQFVWRLNGFFIFFISYICAVNIVTIANMIKDKKNILIYGTILCTFICSWFGTARYLSDYKYEIDHKFEQNIKNAKTIGPYYINREYLPLKACRNIKYMQEREDRTYILKGTASIENEEKEKLTDKMKVNMQEQNAKNETAKLEDNIDGVDKIEDNTGSNTGDNIENNTEKLATLELPYIFYHGYTTKLNGKNIKNYESENGFLCVDIEQSGTLEVEYTGTTLEKVGYAISEVTLIMLIVYCITSKIKKS